MPFIKLQFKPGVNRDQSNYSNEGGWYECDKIRFRSGYPEKIGGWTKSATAFQGVCRQMWNWITTYSNDFLALGTNAKVYIQTGGYYYDITPLRTVNPTMATTATDNCIYISSGSRTVTVTTTSASNVTTGNYVTISGVVGTGTPATLGGIPITELNASQKVTYVSATSFTFDVTTEATSTVAGGGGTGITLKFDIDAGYAIPTNGTGWGAGTWSRGAWGLGTSSGTGILQPQRDWWFDNFDNDLVMNIRNGAAYYWERGTSTDPSVALSTRAMTLEDYATSQSFDPDAVPQKVMQLLVSQQDKHLIAFGAVPFGPGVYTSADFDPLLVRWASQDSPGNWTPATDGTSSAGFFRISRGSRIIRAMPTRQEILIWTDTHLYSMQATGTLDVFYPQEYADNISVMSPRCMATAANITYWMGQDKFYAYTGRVETLPCTLRNHVFNRINLDQAEQVVCGTNEQWNEVWWFYPTNGSNYNNEYVVYNHLERIWYYGTIERTAWLDTPLRHYPQAANTPIVSGNADPTGGYLYSHENGVDDDTLPMSSYILSSDFDLDEGEQFMLTRRLIPDMGFNGSTATSPEVTMELRHRNFPGAPLQTEDEDNARIIATSVDQYTNQVFIRARARQMALKIISEDLGVQWQLGAPRIDARQDGKR
ncbi:MAG: hypothetical protein ACO3AG_00720 [Fluviibacter sp.]